MNARGVVLSSGVTLRCAGCSTTAETSARVRPPGFVIPDPPAGWTLNPKASEEDAWWEPLCPACNSKLAAAVTP